MYLLTVNSKDVLHFLKRKHHKERGEFGNLHLLLQRAWVYLFHLKENQVTSEMAVACQKVVAQVLGLSENMTSLTRKAVQDGERLGGG